MLHILLLILKIIGIIIAVILGILLLLIAILLFVPVRYEVQGRCGGSLDSLKGKVHITWLLHLVRADVLYKNGKMKWRFGLAWIKKGNVGDGKKQTPDSKKTEIDEEADLLTQLEEGIKKQEASLEAVKKEVQNSGMEEEEKTNNEKSIVTETDGSEEIELEKSEKSLAAPQTVRQESTHAPESEERKPEVEIPEKEEPVDSKKNGSFYERILAWIQKIKCTFRKLCDKIKSLSAEKEKVEKFLRDEMHKDAYQRCKKELFRILRHLKPKKTDIRLIYGFDDPYCTGQVLAALSVLYPFISGCMSVTPDFEQQILKGSVYVKGRIYVFHFVQATWNMIWNKNVRQTYHDIRNFKL